MEDRPALPRRSPETARRSLRSAIGWVLLLIALPGFLGSDSRKGWSKEVKKAFKTISAKECLGHVQILASDEYGGRAAGEESGRMASQYICERFAEMGLEPAGTNGYFQSFQLVAKKRSQGAIETTNRLTFEKKRGSGRGGSLEYGKDFLPDPRSGEQWVSGPPIYLSTVKKAESAAAKMDLTGKVVILLATAASEATPMRQEQEEEDEEEKDQEGDGRESGEKGQDGGEDELIDEGPRPFDAIASRGATAILLIPMSRDTWELDPEAWPDGSKEECARIPVVRLSHSGASKLLRKIGGSQDKIARRPDSSREFGKAAITLETSRRGYIYGLGRNVIGILRGHDPTLRDEAIVVGAHLDHVGTPRDRRLTRGRVGKIHNGADDNASGTSGLIELAEAFASGEVVFKRTIIFMSFDAEELGLVGSKHFVASPTFPREKIVAMLNMDMISRNKPREMYFGSDEAFPGLNRLVTSIAEKFDIFLNPEGMEKYMKRSDQAPFIEAGIPAVFIYGGDHPQYHTESDDIELINPRKIEAIARLMFLFAYECANFEGNFK